MGVSKLKVLQAPLHVLEGATKTEKLHALYGQWFKCTRCSLGELRLGDDIVFAEGNPDASVMFVGEAPGEMEEKTAVPFRGAEGELLNQMLAQHSDDPEIWELWKWYRKVAHTPKNRDTFHQAMLTWRHKHFFFANVLACSTPDSRPPLPVEVRACWERLWNIIYLVDPDLIVTFGKIASELLIKRKITVLKDRGKLFDAALPGRLVPISYPVLVMLRPAHLLRKADYNIRGGDYELSMEDMEKIMQISDFLGQHHRGILPLPRSAK